MRQLDALIAEFRTNFERRSSFLIAFLVGGRALLSAYSQSIPSKQRPFGTFPFLDVVFVYLMGPLSPTRRRHVLGIITLLSVVVMWLSSSFLMNVFPLLHALLNARPSLATCVTRNHF